MNASFLISSLVGLSLMGGAHAAPYASAVTIVDSDVTFILNEAADNVTVEFTGGAAPSLDLGARLAGSHTFSKGTATAWRIVARKVAPPGWREGALQQISADTNPLLNFTNQRGVALNKSARTGAAFGRLYVSVGSAAATAEGRAISEGVYVLNPDLTVTALGDGALTGGLTFATSAESPTRVHVDGDGYVYVSDWSDANGSVYMFTADMANGTNILGGPIGAVGSVRPMAAGTLHGSISATAITGSRATNDLTLYTVDEDLQEDINALAPLTQVNSIWRWNLADGMGLPSLTFPKRLDNNSGIRFAGQFCDLVIRDSDATFFKAQRRSNGGESGVFIIKDDGTELDSSLAASQAIGLTLDIFQDTVGIDISPDGNTLAVLRRTDNAIHIIPIVENKFDLANRFLLATESTTAAARDISFDAAGNLYTVSSGQQRLRVYAPGGTSTATTASDNTFTIAFTPLPVSFARIPKITQIDYLTDTVYFRFEFPGTTNPSEFVAQRSTNLSEWFDIPSASINGSNGDYNCEAPAPMEPKQYYRIRRL
jgi:hypothetical protein